MITRTCPICNRDFEAYGKQKYCSKACQDQGRKQTLTAWKDAHNYNESLREKRKAEREKIADEAARERHVQISVFDSKHRERIEAEKKAKLKELKKKAKTGDHYALMKLAEDAGDKLEYWRQYAMYEIEHHEKEYGRRSPRIVNDYSVYESDFAEKVVESITETGRCIQRMNGLGKKL